jgi:hypothetical protein
VHRDATGFTIFNEMLPMLSGDSSWHQVSKCGKSKSIAELKLYQRCDHDGMTLFSNPVACTWAMGVILIEKKRKLPPSPVATRIN